MNRLTQFLLLPLAYTPIILFMLLFYWLRRSADKQEPYQEGATLEFPVASRMRFLVCLVIVLLLAFTPLTLIEAVHAGEGRYAVLIPLAVLTAILAVNPRGVTLDHNGIRQRRWPFPDREIAWRDVAWMKRGANTGATYVKSRYGGRPISFSPVLAGRNRFEHEVRARLRRHDASQDAPPRVGGQELP